MHLNNLKYAWRQVKFRNAMPPLDSNDILAIIDASEKAQRQVFFLRLAVLLLITFSCQAG